jgi:hypothetical protein
MPDYAASTVATVVISAFTLVSEVRVCLGNNGWTNPMLAWLSEGFQAQLEVSLPDSRARRPVAAAPRNQRILGSTDRRCLNPGVLQRVYLPVPIFLA